MLNEESTLEHNKQVNLSNDRHKNTVLGDNLIEQRNKNNSRATKNITKMVIFQGLLNVTGTVPYGIYFILNQSKLVTVTQQFVDFNNAAVLLLYLIPALDIFVYYFFNKLYKEVFLSYLKKIYSFY